MTPVAPTQLVDDDPPPTLTPLVAAPAVMNELKFRALPKSPIQMTGWISEIISWYGLVYHFRRSLLVSAQSPWVGLSFSFGLGREAAFAPGTAVGC